MFQYIGQATIQMDVFAMADNEEDAERFMKEDLAEDCISATSIVIENIEKVTT